MWVMSIVRAVTVISGGDSEFISSRSNMGFITVSLPDVCWDSLIHGSLQPRSQDKKENPYLWKWNR